MPTPPSRMLSMLLYADEYLNLLEADFVSMPAVCGHLPILSLRDFKYVNINMIIIIGSIVKAKRKFTSKFPI